MRPAKVVDDGERMDRHYRFQRYFYDLTRTHYLIGRKYLLNQLRPADGQSVLEIGCGTAWNLAQAARLYPSARLYGVDVSRAMLETASSSLSRKKLSDRVVLAQGDATNFDAQASFGFRTFDRVFISYALSMIPQWREALEHAAGLLSPAGSLHVVDFGHCEALPMPLKQALFAFLRCYSVTPRADLDSALIDIASRQSLSVSRMKLHFGYTDYAGLTRSGSRENS